MKFRFRLATASEAASRRASVDAVKHAALGLPVKKISVGFQCCRTPERGRSLGGVPELKVSQNLFDDTGVVDEAEYS